MLSLKPYMSCLTTVRHIPQVSRCVQRRFVSSVEIIKYDTKDLSGIPGAATIPPHHPSHIAYLKTFQLPEQVTGSASDRLLGRRLVEAWREDGIFQVAIPPGNQVLQTATLTSKEFFARPYAQKAVCVDDQSFSGYIASGEELTDGIRDYSEIFTVTKDLPNSDPRVQQQWPCHGPCPWPSKPFNGAMTSLMNHMGDYGEKILKLTAYGLGLEDENALNKLTVDGWHHMRILRFPHVNRVNGKGKQGRGIGSHTDYGLLVIAAQDEVGGLFVRPPFADETYVNWKVSSAGAHENDDRWSYIPPQPNVFTVFPGDMMQYLTNSYLPSTPHKVGLNTAERFAFAYFHEPNFSAAIKPLKEFQGQNNMNDEPILYGTHFTNMFMRNYPERITAKRMVEEQRMNKLDMISQQPYPYSVQDQS